MIDPGRSLLVVGKPGDHRLNDAVRWLGETWRGIVTQRALTDGTWPGDLMDWEGECLASYRCPAVVPASVLARVRGVALNFHPAPPEYRGIGTVNFALYDGARTYGVTCHHMTARVDSGPIVAVRRFAIDETATVASVLEHSYTLMEALFYEMMTIVCDGGSLPRSAEVWSGPVRTRRELQALCEVSPDMAPEEIRRRVRAVDYPGFPGAQVTLAGVVFRADSAANRCEGRS